MPARPRVKSTFTSMALHIASLLSFPIKGEKRMPKAPSHKKKKYSQICLYPQMALLSLLGFPFPFPVLISFHFHHSTLGIAGITHGPKEFSLRVSLPLLPCNSQMEIQPLFSFSFSSFACIPCSFLGCALDTTRAETGLNP